MLVQRRYVGVPVLLVLLELVVVHRVVVAVVWARDGHVGQAAFAARPMLKLTAQFTKCRHGVADRVEDVQALVEVDDSGEQS